MNSNPHQSSRNNKNLQNMTISSRSYDSMNIDKFPDFMSLSQYSNLSFNHNPITSFLTLPILPNLISLKLDFTKITSFIGANKQPQLSSISLISTPVSSYKYFFEMCLIAFGTQLVRINDKIISSKQRRFARENSGILSKYICSGWIITKGGQPIHLLHYQTRKRICFYTSNQPSNQPSNQNPNEVFNSDDQSNDNARSQISRSTTTNNERESTTTATYASSFVSDSSYVTSSVASYNPYKLDEKTRDDLLTKMIMLSHEWNPPPKVKLSDKDKDNFLENSIFELFRPSMARNRRIVARDQKPENLFKRPVSIQSESPYADERKSYLLRKKEERERRIKQKQEELRRQQEEEEFEFEEEEEEEEEIAEQERIKNENEIQLQDNLQEEKIKDNDVHDANDFNKNDLNEEEENVIESNESPKKEEESAQIEEKDDIKHETKRKSISFRSSSAKIYNEPKETNVQLAPVKSDITHQQKVLDESRNSPLLSESEMEVFRKRRLMSMNKFILNPNSSKKNTENIDDKMEKKRRKTLTHARTVRDIEKPINESNLNNDSTTTNTKKDKFTRRPTFSEIMTNRYREQHNLYPSSQQNKTELDQNLQQPQPENSKFNLTKRKTSFAALDIKHFLEANSKAKADASKDKENETENIKENEAENTKENEADTIEENEIKNDPETQENDHNDKLLDDRINSFLQKQKSEEDAELDLEKLEGNDL